MDIYGDHSSAKHTTPRTNFELLGGQGLPEPHAEPLPFRQSEEDPGEGRGHTLPDLGWPTAWLPSWHKGLHQFPNRRQIGSKVQISLLEPSQKDQREGQPRATRRETRPQLPLLPAPYRVPASGPPRAAPGCCGPQGRWVPAAPTRQGYIPHPWRQLFTAGRQAAGGHGTLGGCVLGRNPQLIIPLALSQTP